MTRGRLPHGIEATSILTSTLITDEESPNMDPNVLQLSYTMALIRFVNGLLDPFQQSSFAVPMQLLAKQLDLPSFFVELRHMGTHESLPTLEMLRIGCKRALNWLYDHYWCHVNSGNFLQKTNFDGDGEIDVYSEVVNWRIVDYEHLIVQFSVYDNLKLYKKTRKVDLNSPLVAKDNSDASSIQNCLENLQKLNLRDADLLAELMIRKFVIIYPRDKLKSKNIKYNPLFQKLYKPLFDLFGLQFNIKLFKKIVDLIDGKPLSNVNKRVFKRLGFALQLSQEETAQLAEWLPELVEYILTSKELLPVTKQVVDFLIDKIELLKEYTPMPSTKLFLLLSNIIKNNEPIYGKNLIEQVCQRAKEWEALEKTRQNFKLPPSLDELLAEENPRKRKQDTDIDGKDIDIDGKDIDIDGKDIDIDGKDIDIDGKDIDIDGKDIDIDGKDIDIDYNKKLQKIEKRIFLFDQDQDWKQTPFGISS
ncbi:LAS1 [Candida oxycetoniae]|uniref:LAS1 n=1 Tax=Candida oxycetoniae TaxID=497107 RepID=A0AAI9WZB2_9ASCO|nr:LAS1 [Candida oxycetoniae]KAI3405725.2 LAS1 [Candida oxycetoniae]